MDENLTIFFTKNTWKNFRRWYNNKNGE